jgi:hypothetical protein
MSYLFAVVRDELGADEPSVPLAVFETIEDAFAWGSERFQGKAFRLRRVSVDSPLVDQAIRRREQAARAQG